MAKRQHPSAISRHDKDDLMALIRERESDVVTKSAVSLRSTLTRRELEVIRLVARGGNNYEIANTLFISVNTVMRHMTHIFTKTSTSNRVEAALFAARNGLL